VRIVYTVQQLRPGRWAVGDFGENRLKITPASDRRIQRRAVNAGLRTVKRNFGRQIKDKTIDFDTGLDRAVIVIGK